MKILTRYIVREHVGPLAFSLSALTILLLLNQVAKEFGMLVGKGLSWGVIGEFFYLSIPFIVAMTLPMAVLVAVLYTFSRLAAENEVTALRASGVTIVRLVRPVMLGGAVLAIVMVLFNDQVLPRSNHRLRTLQMDIARKKPTFALREQVINEVIPGRIYLKAGHIDEATNKLREVFIYNFEDPAHRKTIYADSGQMGLTGNSSTLEMTLHHGYVLQVPADDPASLQRLYFTDDLVRVRGVGNTFEKTEKDTYKSQREMTVCEMDRQYQSGAYQLDAARFDLAQMLGNAARFAATGAEPSGINPPLPAARRTSGQVYCEFMMRVLGAWAGDSTAAASREPRAVRAAASREPRAARRHGRVDRQGARLSAVQLAIASATPFSRPTATLTAHGSRPTARLAARGSQLATPQHPSTTLGTLKPRAAGGPAAPVQPRRQMLEGPVVTPGAIDVIRARMTDARITMNRYQVEIQKKFALGAACIVFVLFGAPIALRFPRGGVGLVIGVSVVAFALYYVCLIGGEALADKLVIGPFWAMWGANVLFTVIGVIMLVKADRPGATTRSGDLTEKLEAIGTWLARRTGRLRYVPGEQRRVA